MSTYKWDGNVLTSKYFSILRSINLDRDYRVCMSYTVYLNGEIDRLTFEHDFRKQTGRKLWNELFWRICGCCDSVDNITFFSGKWYINIQSVHSFTDLVPWTCSDMDLLYKLIEEKDKLIVYPIFDKLDLKFEECCEQRVPSLRQVVVRKLKKDYVFCMRSTALYYKLLGGRDEGENGSNGNQFERMLASIDLISQMCEGVS